MSDNSTIDSSGDNNEYVLASSNANGWPITQVRLEVAQPCFDTFTQSGLLSTDDNMMYQYFEYGFMD